MGPVLVFIYSTMSQILDFHGFFLCPIALLDKFFGGTQKLLFTKFYSNFSIKIHTFTCTKILQWTGVRHSSYYIGLKAHHWITLLKFGFPLLVILKSCILWLGFPSSHNTFKINMLRAFLPCFFNFTIVNAQNYDKHLCRQNSVRVN